MAIEIAVSNKRVFSFNGQEYSTLPELKAAMLTDVFTEVGQTGIVPAVNVEKILANSDRIVEILRYSGRKPRTPRPEGWVPPARKPRKPKKVVKSVLPEVKE